MGAVFVAAVRGGRGARSGIGVWTACDGASSEGKFADLTLASGRVTKLTSAADTTRDDARSYSTAPLDDVDRGRIGAARLSWVRADSVSRDREHEPRGRGGTLARFASEWPRGPSRDP